MATEGRSWHSYVFLNISCFIGKLVFGLTSEWPHAWPLIRPEKLGSFSSQAPDP